MRNAIRCCISCILPCGALDVIRIVHANGRVEEISATVKAAEIMKLHPKHVLKKPTSSPSAGDGIPKIVVVPPEAELKRGRIYFLMPAAPPPAAAEKTRRRSASAAKRKKKEQETNSAPTAKTGCSISAAANLLLSDRYLTEILSEKTGSRRRGRVGVWRPHLESISETPVEAA